MTSHEFARQLLQGPDLLVLTPRVLEYSDDEENGMATPHVQEHDGKDSVTGEPVRVLIMLALDRHPLGLSGAGHLLIYEPERLRQRMH